ncbi:hypothetical protein KUCAC02_036330 [Chaenocephalus aceratus]|nr:hypothetical protein KUCAC02_036330 [Chaenocephalus aceratus]
MISFCSGAEERRAAASEAEKQAPRGGLENGEESVELRVKNKGIHPSDRAPLGVRALCRPAGSQYPRYSRYSRYSQLNAAHRNFGTKAAKSFSSEKHEKTRLLSRCRL